MRRIRHRLPSGFGTIRNLGKGRRKPFAVHPPAQAGELNQNGERMWKRPPALCYVESWEDGLKVLALYHAGIYQAGMENSLGSAGAFHAETDDEALFRYCRQVMEDIERIRSGKSPAGTGRFFPEGTPEKGTGAEAFPTFEQVYRSFYEHKYGPHAQRRLSAAAKTAMDSAYKRFAPFYRTPLDDISVDDMQQMVNDVADAGFSRSTVCRVVTLAHQIYRYAYPRGWCRKENGRYVEMPSAKEETHYQDFTDAELEILWEHQQDPVVQNILVMCYSGFRVGEYEKENFRVCTDADGRPDYFQGGVKTEAGKDRIVPVHSAVAEMVRGMNGVFFCGKNSGWFRKEMKWKLLELGIDGTSADGTKRYHTPHSCRHTFSRLCESCGVNEADRRRMMGHSLRNDITNGVYGHRTVQELKEQIEKIRRF